MLALALLLLPVSAGATDTFVVTPAPAAKRIAKPVAKDICHQIVRHDDMASCYFAAGDSRMVIWALKTTPKRSLTYPNDAANNAALIRTFYQYSVSYGHLGDTANAQTYISLAYGFPDAEKWVHEPLWKQIVAQYKLTKTDVRDSGNKFVAPKWQADTQWARDQGMSEEEVEEVKYRGRPCHIETYNSGDSYLKETFWYCNADGGYEEGVTFVNGHKTSDYTP
jgi:hypothetical protein